jgi:hypothetical protein
MRKVALTIMVIALGCTVASAHPAVKQVQHPWSGPKVTVHTSTAHHASSAHPGVPNKYWLPGYGDIRTCHGTCLTSPFWGKFFDFFAYYLPHHI